MDQIDPKETAEERKQNRLKGMGDAFNKFRITMENNKPFYSQAVYDSILNIYKTCHLEHIQYSRSHEDFQDEKYWVQAEKNQNNIISEIDSCCEIIRSRIYSVSVSK